MTIVSVRLTFIFFLIALSATCAFGQPGKKPAAGPPSKRYRAFWNGNERWAGAAWWANPLWDWSRDGKGGIRVPISEDRALSLLPFQLDRSGHSFSIHITMTFTFRRFHVPNFVLAGLALGRKGPMNDYRSAAVYRKSQLPALIRADGKITLNKRVSKTSVSLTKGPIILKLVGKKQNQNVLLTFTASQRKTSAFVQTSVPLSFIDGLISLVSDGPRRWATGPTYESVSFKGFNLDGNMFKRKNGRTFGPVMWTQYSISDKVLRLQAQLGPFEKPKFAHLQLFSSQHSKASRNLTTKSHPLSRTAQFTVSNWDFTKPQKYSVRVYVDRWYTYSGTIRKEPTIGQKFQLAAFSCDEGYLFPQNDMVSQVKRQNPDFLFFAGDQIYEGVGDFSTERFSPLYISMLDYLRKWYLFGWVWGPLLRDRPSVIIPDDHDVYQGNLWGDGGRATRKPGQRDWISGGYVMPKEWISAVERCHTGHLPPSSHQYLTPMGLKPYYTSLKYGGISMAVLEDRKFKTAPLSLPLKDKKKGSGGQLLGERQEEFLTKWAKSWKQSSMKVAFSQTMFSDPATHQGRQLKSARASTDSGAWPFDARNRVVKLMGKYNILSVHGDQHLGMLARCGVKTHNDGNVAFLVPGTANGHPRAWWPGAKSTPKPNERKQYTGKYYDNSGHPINVLAVANPAPLSNIPDVWSRSSTSRIQVGRAKGSGYGLVSLNRLKKTATFHLYKVGRANDEFNGFPKTVRIGGKPWK